jgi:hypothetical protein
MPARVSSSVDHLLRREVVEWVQARIRLPSAEGLMFALLAGIEVEVGLCSVREGKSEASAQEEAACQC